MKNKVKKILSLNDLEEFYSKYKKSMHFSSKETGYQLAVQVPASFKKDEEYTDDTLLYCLVKAFHVGMNRNKSSVTLEAAEKAMKTMAYKPVLANFCEYEENGEMIKDFTAHDMELDEDGNIVYFEHQIGCFTADEPWLEHDDELDKDYIYAYVAIPREYTDAVSIIERKNGTKVSVELLINDLSYNAKEKVMELNDVTVSGITCLGSKVVNGQKIADVEEGMLGSRLDIKDFSEENNSLLSSLNMEENSKLIDTLEKLNKSIENLSKFNNINGENQDNVGKEEINVEKEEIEVKEEVIETQEGEVTETESTEEVTETVTETESENTVEETPDVVETEACGDKKKEKCAEDEESDSDEEQKDEDKTEVKEEESKDDAEEDDEAKEEEKCGDKKKYSKTFELSFDDIRCGLYELLRPYEEADNEWYYVNEVFESYFIYSGMSGKVYGQKYTKEAETVAFDGERYEVFLEYLTESEKTELETIRSNYSSIEKELNSYKDAEEIFEKKTVFEDDAYSAYLDTKEFKTLMSEDTLKKFTKEELSEKADAALGKLVKTNKAFALEEKVESKPTMFGFAKVDHKSNFFDGLLGK